MVIFICKHRILSLFLFSVALQIFSLFLLSMFSLFALGIHGDLLIRRIIKDILLRVINLLVARGCYVGILTLGHVRRIRRWIRWQGVVRQFHVLDGRRWTTDCIDVVVIVLPQWRAWSAACLCLTASVSAAEEQENKTNNQNQEANNRGNCEKYITASGLLSLQ